MLGERVSGEPFSAVSLQTQLSVLPSKTIGFAVKKQGVVKQDQLCEPKRHRNLDILVVILSPCVHAIGIPVWLLSIIARSIQPISSPRCAH